MTDWAAFTLAMSAFLCSHFVPRLWGLREKLIAAFGRRIYFSAYGVLSLVLLIWVIVSAGRAPYIELWPQQPWMRWLPNLAMPLAFVLTTCGMGVANAGTLGGSASREFNPSDPGFAAISRHPLLLALLLWAATHLVANGDLAHVILFGCFAVFPLIAMWAFDQKARRLLGAKSNDLFFHSSWLSLFPLITIDWWRNNAGAVVTRGSIGLLIWVGALQLHDVVIGAWPFP